MIECDVCAVAIYIEDGLVWCLKSNQKRLRAMEKKHILRKKDDKWKGKGIRKNGNLLCMHLSFYVFRCEWKFVFFN